MEKVKVIKNNNYKSLVNELKDIISKNKYQAYKAVDNIKVQAYWRIGERIVREEIKYKDRAGYEEYLVGKLALDLDIRKRFLYEIIKFYRIYPIVRTLSAQLGWSHYVELIINTWSIRELRKNIKNQLYQKTDNKEVQEISKIVLRKKVNLNNIFKPEYDLNFLTIAQSHQEKELESKIISNIESFLKELGSDFSFLERQMPILIDGQKHFIDLVLFHRGIPCIVLVDLKVGKLDSGDIGQMNKYISYYRRNRQYISEADAIGLIICREVGHEEVFYALGGLEEKIFVAKYKIKLPDIEKIKRLIRKI